MYVFLASTHPCSHSHDTTTEDQEMGLEHDKVQQQIDMNFQDIVAFLTEQFGEVDTDEKEHKVTVSVDGSKAVVDSLKFVSFIKIPGVNIG